VLITLFSGCISNNGNDENDNDYIGYSYDLKIQTNKSRNFTIICPIFILSNGSNTKINEYLAIIDGSCNYSFNKTDKGIGLFINSNQNCSFYMKNDKRLDIPKEKGVQLFLSQGNTSSMTSEQKKYYWAEKYFIYFDSKSNLNLSFKLEINVYYSSEMATLSIDNTLKKGWNEYSAFIESQGD
jgi:hypothetical protein